jgi:hypothetical protein
MINLLGRRWIAAASIKRAVGQCGHFPSRKDDGNSEGQGTLNARQRAPQVACKNAGGMSIGATRSKQLLPLS